MNELKKIQLSNGLSAYICDSCLNGNHMTDDSFDHTKGPPERRDCKAVGKTEKGKTVQCQCSPDYPELWAQVFPGCFNGCEAVELLGVGECESVCPKKFGKK